MQIEVFVFSRNEICSSGERNTLHLELKDFQDFTVTIE